MEYRKFSGYIENEWLDHRANLKWFKPIAKYELKQDFPSWIVLYIFGKKTGYPDTSIKASKN